MRFNVRADMLNAALVCVSDETTRHYLNGVYFEPIGGDDIRIVATDGHILFQGVSRIEQPDGGGLTEPVILGFGAQKRLAGFTCRKLPKTTDSCASIDTEAGIARVGKEIVQVTEVIGTYPDFAQVMPETVSGEPAQFADKIHAAIYEVGRRINSPPTICFNGGGPAPVAYPENPMALVVAMPLRVARIKTWPPANLRKGRLFHN